MNRVWFVLLVSYLIIVASPIYSSYKYNRINNVKSKEIIVDRSLLKKGQKILVSGTTQFNIIKPNQLLIFPIYNSSKKWGYINRKGQIVIKPQFDRVSMDISEGLLAVKMKGKWRYLNEYGELAITNEYISAQNFSNGVAVISSEKDSSRGFDDYHDLVVNNYYGVIDSKGKRVIPSNFSCIYNFMDGVSWTSGKYNPFSFGVINTKGDIILPYGKYDNTIMTGHYWFSEGKSFVMSGLYDPMGRNGVPYCCFVDTKGKEIISVDYMNDATYFDQGVCFVRVGYKWGLIDNNGKWIIHPSYAACYSFSPGYYSIFRYTDTITTSVEKYGGIGPMYRRPWIYTFSDDLALVEKNDKIGRIDIDEKGKFGFIDKKGNEIIKPQYQDANFFSEGLAAVKVKGKYGYINKINKMIIKPKYEKASYFREGLSPVKIKNKYGCIDKTGKIIIKPIYDYIDIFRNGLAVFYKGKQWGYVNHKGKEVWCGKYISNDNNEE